METYDVVESRDEELDKLIKMYNTFDIVNAPIPGCSKDVVRTLLREGDMKLRDSVTSKVIDITIHTISYFFSAIFQFPTTNNKSPIIHIYTSAFQYLKKF